MRTASEGPVLSVVLQAPHVIAAGRGRPTRRTVSLSRYSLVRFGESSSSLELAPRCCQLWSYTSHSPPYDIWWVNVIRADSFSLSDGLDLASGIGRAPSNATIW